MISMLYVFTSFGMLPSDGDVFITLAFPVDVTVCFWATLLWAYWWRGRIANAGCVSRRPAICFTTLGGFTSYFEAVVLD